MNFHRITTSSVASAHHTHTYTFWRTPAAPKVSSSLLPTSFGCLLLYVLYFFVVDDGGSNVVELVVVVAVVVDVLGVVIGPHRLMGTGGGGGGIVGVGPHTLNTIFMLYVEHRPPIRRCRSSLVDVDIK